MAELNMYAVEQWITSVANGRFHYTKVLDGGVSPKLYPQLRVYVSRCCEKGLCEAEGKNDGWYRPIQEIPQPVDFKGVKGKTDFPLMLPFGLREFVFIYPNTVTVVAGSKSSGKTGFLYRTAKLNKGILPVVVLSNMEGGREQMYDRFLAMGIDLTTEQDIKVYEVHSNFHDFIRDPYTIYIIDYIDVPESGEFYMIAGQITKVRRNLNNSVAVIGLQKPANRDIAYGNEQTKKDATLYIALDSKKLKIIDAKVPANPKIIPNNKIWTFKYSEEGTDFINIRSEENYE